MYITYLYVFTMIVDISVIYSYNTSYSIMEQSDDNITDMVNC